MERAKSSPKAGRQQSGISSDEVVNPQHYRRLTLKQTMDAENVLLGQDTPRYELILLDIRLKGGMTGMEAQLQGHSFLRTAVSHLANLRYVSEIDGNMLILTTGDRLPISRARKKDVMAGLAKYLGGTA